MTDMSRCRIRDLLPKIHLGDQEPGPLNSITDVPGVLVHTETIRSAPGAEDGSVNTGVTVILPRKEFFRSACYSGIFRFNGNGELTGSHWIEETGLLHSPIVLTNTFSIGDSYRGVYQFCAEETKRQADENLIWWVLPVIGETYDGYLNDVSQFAVKPEHVVQGIKNASADRVQEGNTGGGTGMMCHEYKGGTGSSSRVVPGFRLGSDGQLEEASYTLGALVQANYGRREDFRVAGVPIGRISRRQSAETPQEADVRVEKEKKDGSIIIVIATDAPLHPLQLQRLAKRATVGLSRVGGVGHNQSGDIFLAFSTTNEIPVQETVRRNHWNPEPMPIQAVVDATINSLYVAAADAVEESIYNALCMAETTVGYKERKVEAIDLKMLKDTMSKYVF
jgi:D-aminopeptidase